MPSADLAVFASPDFNPSEYANIILAGELYPVESQSTGPSKSQEPPAKEDISEAISKLTNGIDDVTKQIRRLVLQHHEDLLSQAANSNALSGSLTSVRSSITELDKSLEKLRFKVHDPYRSLQRHVTRLRYLQQASDLLRRISRFITLARRLHVQMSELDQSLGSDFSQLENKLPTMNHESRDEADRILAKGALCLAELLTCLDEPLVQMTYPNSDDKLTDVGFKPNKNTLRSVDLVDHYMPLVEGSKNRITQIMEIMLYAGLASRDSTMLASSLQIAYNLKSLPEFVHSLMSDVVKGMEDHVRAAFDMTKLSKDALAKEVATAAHLSSAYKSRVRTEPTNITAPQWTTMFWDRLEALLEDLTDSCIKVYLLENVLSFKRDVVTQTLFLDEAMKSLENKPSSMFWTALAQSLEAYIRDSIKSSTFMQQTLCAGYPKLLRLFHAFFAQVAPHTDTTYTQSYQSPETVLILNALSNPETNYLSKSMMKMNEVVAQAFAGGFRAPPSTAEGLNMAHSIANELDAGRFDPLLVRALAKNVLLVLKSITSRADVLVVRDRAAFSLVGPSATPQQVVNTQITTFLYQCWSKLVQLKEEYSDAVFNVLQPGIQELHELYQSLVDPINTSIRRETSAIISKVHRIDLGKQANPDIGASPYIRELTEKLSFIKTEILSRYNLDEAGRTWAISIVKFTVKTFLLHASIAKPLSENGKLQLTNDMTELEFILSAFLTEGSQIRRNQGIELIGEEYAALRGMRPLLFLNNEQLTNPAFTNGLRPLLVLHHILVRSPMPLPHALHGWQEAEYVRWVEEHSEEETWTLVESGLEHWEKISESEGRGGEAREYPDLARKVLKDARGASETLKPPQPPRPINDSTSALDYKRSHRVRPRPLPATDVPRPRSAEEAVTNILYNTPPPSLQPYKKHVLNCLVQNEPGVLSRVSGILAGRGFNIDSLVVCRTEVRDLSRMCIVLSGQEGVVEQARRQLEDLVPVWAVLDYTDTKTISRELLLVKVSILGPEYLEEQLLGGPSHDPRNPRDEIVKDREAATLVQYAERTGQADVYEQHTLPITPSEALRIKHQHLHSISVLAQQFGAKIVDVSENSVIVEMTAKTSRVEAFLSLVKPFGILEAARTGLMAMPRTPISRSPEEDDTVAGEDGVDASLLPPG
ncbi:hypothetical protein APHAL10511_000105 [Amanita phalloides]|nr:hypothetical protein APHAL10511_000105 [Amanita phalloides]